MELQYRLLSYAIVGFIVFLIALFAIPAFTVSMIVRNWGQDIYPFPYSVFLQNFGDYFWVYLGASFGFGFVIFLILAIAVELDL